MSQKNRFNKLLKSENVQMVLFALLCTLLAFAVFAGQQISSNVVTFAKTGDQDKLYYAAFMKIRECLMNGESLIGVDSSSFNASTEFYLRPNIPVAYFPHFLFAALATEFSPRGMYLLLYALHMFASVFAMQMVCRSYFRIDLKLAMVVASLQTYLMCHEAWLSSFYFITALAPICFLAFLEAWYTRGIGRKAAAALCAVFALTSGYITASVVLFILTYLFALLYVCLADGRKLSFAGWLRFSAPMAAGGVVCLPWCLQLLLYVATNVKARSTLADAVYYKFSLNDLPSIISNFSFSSTSATEGVASFSLGVITCIVLALAVKERVIDRLTQQESAIVKASAGLFVLIVIWSTETTAVTGWLYALLPVIGGMHIPNRYFTTVMPFFYLSVGILADKICWEKHGKLLRILGALLLGGTAACLLTTRMGVSIPLLRENNFYIEMPTAAAFCFALRPKDEQTEVKYRPVTVWSCFLWCFTLLLAGSEQINQAHTVYAPADEVAARSIVYNQQTIAAIDRYISLTGGGKPVFRYVAYDSLESVPEYLQPNYEWYNYSAFDLCNYTGYELQLSTPQAYRAGHWWFNQYDWEYVVNTRADYFMTDYATIDGNRAFFDTIIDWDKGTADLGNGRIMVSFHRFIPSVICGTPYVFEDRDSLDNGYFYSHDLSYADIVRFDTDQSSYYDLTICSDRPSVLAFLPYANRCYRYNIDGVEIAPEIIHMQAIFRADAGEHTLSVRYVNPMGKLGYLLVLGGAAGLCVFTILAVQTPRFRRRFLSRKGKR